MISYVQSTAETSASTQALYALLVDPIPFFSALGHIWIWGAYDKSSRSFKPFVEAQDPDPQRLAGVLVLGIEWEKGAKPHVTEVEISGPTVSNLEVAYRIKSIDERVLMTVRSKVQPSNNRNKLIVDIEASYVLDWKSLFLSPIFGGKLDLDHFLRHLIEVHLRGYIKNYLERRAMSAKSIEPVLNTVADAKNLSPTLRDLLNRIDRGIISISGRDFVLVIEVEEGKIKDALYREGSKEIKGAEAVNVASSKSGVVHLRVYNVRPEDVIFRLAAGLP